MNDSQETVLIVDDNPENIDVLVAALEADFKLKISRSGEKALAIAASEVPPNIILLDIIMPGMDGYEVCRRLKQNPQTSDIPVIFVTVKDDTEDEMQGLLLGAVDYITKPIKPPNVRARVQTHLALQRARAELQRQNEELRQAAKLREDVENITRHDLKNPLQVIIGSTELLMLCLDQKTPDVQLLQDIQDAGMRMLQMINSSLDIFKMERGFYRLIPVPVDLLALTVKIVREKTSALKRRNLNVNITREGRPLQSGQSCLIQGEELLCYSMLANLLKNAIEASPPGNRIHVNFEVRPHTVVQIHNLGVVPMPIRGCFFDKYITHNKPGGTGLGNYSARLIAETLQGSISFTTDENDGTTVRLEFPSIEGPPAEGSRPPQ